MIFFLFPRKRKIYNRLTDEGRSILWIIFLEQQMEQLIVVNKEDKLFDFVQKKTDQYLTVR